MNPTTGEPYSTELPACRAYELVSPPYTDGIEFPIESNFIEHRPGFLITEGGVVFGNSQATPPGTGALPNGDNLGVFRSERTPSGWLTRDLVPTAQAAPVELEGIASADTSSALVSTPISLSPEDQDNLGERPETGFDLYVVSDDGAPPLFVTHGEISDVAFQGHPEPFTSNVHSGVFANPTLTAVGFSTREINPLSPEDPGQVGNCYIWADARNKLAGLTNPANPVPSEVNCRYYAVAADGRPIVRVTSGRAGTGLIFALDPSGNIGVDGLGGATTQLSGPTPEDASFDAISPDGETVYLTTTIDKLTPAAEGDAGADLYAVDVSTTGGLLSGHQAPAICVSCGHNGAGPEWLGQSADGSQVFFKTSEGIWSWTKATGATLLAPAADDLEHLVPSGTGQYAIATANGASEVYLLTAGSAPRLITSPTVATTYTPVAVSDSGQRVVYDAGTGTSEAIYEWTADQTGQISPMGATQGYTALGTAGAELESVFFEAHESLIPADLNAGSTDIYDARTDGGLPTPRELASESKTPNPVAPSIPTYTGNLVPPSVQPAELPPDTSHPMTAAKPLTRAQKLSKALKACKKKRIRKKRAACEKAAHKAYAATKGKRK